MYCACGLNKFVFNMYLIVLFQYLLFEFEFQQNFYKFVIQDPLL